MPRRDGEAVGYLTSALVTSGAVAACVGPTDGERAIGTRLSPTLFWKVIGATEKYAIDGKRIRRLTLGLEIKNAGSVLDLAQLTANDAIHSAIADAIAAAPSWIMKGPMLSGFGSFAGTPDVLHIAYEVTS
jgi:hypothetical protein